jgi:hypothetical protein
VGDPLAELAEGNASILVDLIIALVITNIVVLLAVLIEAGHLRRRSMGARSIRNMDTDEEIENQVGAL